jgi:hypothetical protein
MKIRRDQRRILEDICREELDAAYRRIHERLEEIEVHPPVSREVAEDGFGSVRRFYEDLTDKEWTDPDERSLRSIHGSDAREIKGLMREAYRRCPVLPIPSFKYLINVARKSEGPTSFIPNDSMRNSDAISAMERERLANFLAEHLSEAAGEIISRLHLSDKTGVVVREQLEHAQGTIVARFSPLV